MDNEPASAKIKKFFTKYPHELNYDPEKLCFSWVYQSQDRTKIPEESGVYALFSHSGEKIQKVGKAEGAGGLRSRFKRYTYKKNDEKLKKDPTVALWLRVMTNQLFNQKLTLYYILTPPKLIENEISSHFNFDGVYLQWARDLEYRLSHAVNLECASSNLVDTHMLLSGMD
jgi:hypothetical protein